LSCLRNGKMSDACCLLPVVRGKKQKDYKWKLKIIRIILFIPSKE